MNDDKAIVQVALTGCVHHKADNPALPVTPDEVRGDVRRCLDEGASVFHIHARDQAGRPTMNANWYRQFVDAAAQDGATVNVSCSGRWAHAYWERAAPLSVPGADMGTLAMGSMNFPGRANVNDPFTIDALAKMARRSGVVPELECFELGHVHYAKYLIRKDVLEPPHIFNFVLGNLGTCPAERRWLQAMVEMLPEGARWFGTGVGRYARRMTNWALVQDGHIRVGLEDSLWMDKARTDPATNPRLVRRAVEAARLLGREPATPDDARGILEL